MFWNRRKTIPVEEILTIEIKPGWKKGTKITFPEKGNEQPGITPADLVFIIDEKPHKLFTRDGNDLVITQKISLAEALTGYTVHLTTLDGRNLTIPINNVIHPTYEEIVPREGMPLPKEPTRRGNLKIKFDIKFPSRLTSDQKVGIKKLLSPWSKLSCWPCSWIRCNIVFETDFGTGGVESVGRSEDQRSTIKGKWEENLCPYLSDLVMDNGFA